MKGVYFLFSGTICSFGFNKRSTISPIPLQTVEVMMLIVKFIADSITINGALLLATKIIIPAVRPLFSKVVYSVKKAKHKGMPIPNEMPHKKETLKTYANDRWKKLSNTEVIIPKSIHK